MRPVAAAPARLVRFSSLCGRCASLVRSRGWWRRLRACDRAAGEKLSAAAALCPYARLSVSVLLSQSKNRSGRRCSSGDVTKVLSLDGFFVQKKHLKSHIVGMRHHLSLLCARSRALHHTASPPFHPSSAAECRQMLAAATEGEASFLPSLNNGRAAHNGQCIG